MYTRFWGGLGIVFGIAMLSIAIEKQILQLRRSSTRQEYQLEVLREEHRRAQLEMFERGAPARLIEAIQKGEVSYLAPDAVAEPELTLEPAGTASGSERNPTLRAEEPQTQVR